MVESEEKITMARAPMVTRELVGTEAKVLTVNTETAETGYTALTVQGKYKTAENLLKAIKKVYETEALTVVKVVEFKEVHKLYGMPCSDFYKNAIELDTVTRKPLAE